MCGGGGSPSIPSGVVRLIGVLIALKWTYLFWNDIPIAQKEIYGGGSPSIPGGVVRLIGVLIALKWTYLLWNVIPIAQNEIYRCSAG